MILSLLLATTGGLVHILVVGIVLALIIYVAFWALGYLGVPEPIRKVITVIIVVAACIWLIVNLLPALGVSY